MKTQVFFTGMGLALLFLFACQKEKSFEKAAGNGGNTSADFRAKINNQQWVAADSTRGASIIGGITNITGISSDNMQISITLNGTSAGNYTLDQNSFNVGTFIDRNSVNTFAFATNQGLDTTQAGGTVVITEINTASKTISGNFQFKVFRGLDQQQLLITEGVFTNLPYVTSLPPASNTDSFFVKADGTGWNPPSITTSISMGKLIIAASETDASRSIGLVMPQDVMVGLHQMDFGAGNFFGEYNPNPSSFLVSDTSGTLTIIENNSSTRRIKGTFQFKADDASGGSQTALLTEGSFSVGY
ncbi:MAG TPA: DUF6252 family protein [Puia sp.]|nr:DUF6252 family protein [Puia sp.]